MKPGMGWPIGIVAVLGTTVIANLVVMRIANGDAAFAIEPDYYQRAVAFDSTLAIERRSDSLRWSAAAQFLLGADASHPLLRVTLTDARHEPVLGASVTVAAMANARANHVLRGTLRETSRGHYETSLAAEFVGQWEIRIRALRGTDQFVTTTRTDLAPSSGAATPLAPTAITSNRALLVR